MTSNQRQNLVVVFAVQLLVERLAQVVNSNSHITGLVALRPDAVNSVLPFGLCLDQTRESTALSFTPNVDNCLTANRDPKARGERKERLGRLEPPDLPVPKDPLEMTVRRETP